MRGATLLRQRLGVPVRRGEHRAGLAADHEHRSAGVTGHDAAHGRRIGDVEEGPGRGVDLLAASWRVVTSSWSWVSVSPALLARASAVPNEPMLKMRRTGFHSVPGDEPSSKGMSSMWDVL
jgi:hypothetical protein